MIAGHRIAASSEEIRELVDAHFENNENPHVTITRIWALLNAERIEPAVLRERGSKAARSPTNKC
jgi:hypothetical protein